MNSRARMKVSHKRVQLAEPYVIRPSEVAGHSESQEIILIPEYRNFESGTRGKMHIKIHFVEQQSPGRRDRSFNAYLRPRAALEFGSALTDLAQRMLGSDILDLLSD